MMLARINQTSRHYKMIALWALVVMSLGLGLSIIGFIELQKISKERLFIESERNARNKVAQIQTNINISFDSLTSVARLYQAFGDISSGQLQQTYQKDTHYHQGTMGLAWVPAVAGSDIQTFEAQVKASGESGYRVYDLTGHGMQTPVNAQTQYFPVRAVFPPIVQDLQPGLNLAALATRSQIMKKAFHSGQITITNRFSVFENGKHLYGFQAFKPLIAEVSGVKTLLGFVVGLYDINTLIENTFNGADFDVVFYDGASSSEQLLYSSYADINSVSDMLSTAEFHWTFPLQVGDKQWLVNIFPRTSAQQSAAMLAPFSGLILGSIITTLLTLYLVISLVRAKQISELTSDLEGTSTQLNLQKQLRDEADRANAAKSRLFRAASHDLRQPLHTIALLTSLLTETDSPQQQKGLSERINKAVKSMEALFANLLDLNQLETGVITPQIETFAIGKLLDNLYLAFEIEAEEKGLSFRMVYCSKSVRTDYALLERMLRNLVSNAIRYTPQGTVLLGCRHKQNLLRICVIDTGIGMSNETREHIYAEFYRDATAKQLSTDGLGLGLSIVHKTAEQLGLSFGVQSVAGKGSLFYIDVPTSDGVPNVAGESPPTTTDVQGKVIWLIEDDAEALHSMQQLLTSRGCDVEAFTCRDALLTFLQSSPAKPDIVVMDYQLHNDHGPALHALIETHFNTAIKGLIITAALDKSADIKQLYPALDIIFKPVDTSAFLSWIAQQHTST